MNADTNKLSEVEYIKSNSNYLRGTLEESLANTLTGALAPDDTQVIKFHGSYQQHDRDLEGERKKQRLEPLYQFMIRVRMAGGMASAHQWEVIDDLAGKYGNGTIKLTTRQAFQMHGILKRNLKSTLAEMNNVLMDTIAACGDVNRNVMCTPVPLQSEVHEEVYQIASGVSHHLLPNSRAYHEIWLDQEKVVGGEDSEPIYGATYLPRKFKIAFAIPPNNDTDIFSNDLSFIAIENQGQLEGFNVCVGGGMGMTFGMKETYPRLADVIGFIPKDRVNEVAEQVVKIQRDFGNRENRKNARFKYTLDRLGLPWFLDELHRRLGWEFAPARDYTFERNGDSFGWSRGIDKRWYLTLFIEGGRVSDTEKLLLRTALREIASLKVSDFRLTGNQNLVLGRISEKDRARVIAILARYGILPQSRISGLRKNSIACVALNTCSLAFAESERYLPRLIDKIEMLLDKNKLSDEDIVIRMTGCPNGCGRPYLGEIGFVGRAPGLYNMYLGAGFAGNRLNKLYKENVNEDLILNELKGLLSHFARERMDKERFGDFVIRAGYVKETRSGLDFHSV